LQEQVIKGLKNKLQSKQKLLSEYQGIDKDYYIANMFEREIYDYVKIKETNKNINNEFKIYYKVFNKLYEQQQLLKDILN